MTKVFIPFLDASWLTPVVDWLTTGNSPTYISTKIAATLVVRNSAKIRASGCRFRSSGCWIQKDLSKIGHTLPKLDIPLRNRALRFRFQPNF